MRRTVLVPLFAGLALVTSAAFIPVNAPAAAPATGRYLVRVRSRADVAGAQSLATQLGASVDRSLPDVRLLVISATSPEASVLAADPRIVGVAADRPVRVAPEGSASQVPAASGATASPSSRSASSAPSVAGPIPGPLFPDPAFGLAGLMWNFDRLGLGGGWSKTAGEGWVRVGVVSTGIDDTHAEMATKVVGVQDFTTAEDPNICSTDYALPTDAQLATAFGAPSANLDFHGFGTFVAGQIAARVDGSGVNGIAPRVGLVSLKVAQNCGVAYDSTIISAILYAAHQGIDVVVVPFAYYLDKGDPAQKLIYQAYAAAVKRATALGTVVIAPAGDQHAAIGKGGKVLSHGTLGAPPGGADDYGLFEVPGGIPGVVDVSSTQNVVNAASASCPSDSLAAGSHQWCKPSSDAHQPFGAGKKNQLAYSSNYGPRIDIAAPGGARKFNLPTWDRGGTEGWPWTGTSSVEGGTSVADGHNAWDVYGITSDYATEIPCFTFTSDPVFPDNQCYAVQEGSGIAAADVAGVYALTLSAHPKLLSDVAGLTSRVLGSAKAAHNATPPLKASDTSAGDISGGACTLGDCHLGGGAISDSSAYGAGIAQAP